MIKIRSEKIVRVSFVSMSILVGGQNHARFVFSVFGAGKKDFSAMVEVES